MTSTGVYLKSGLLHAARNPHLVLLDMTAKLVWVAGAVVVFGVAGARFASRLELADGDLAAFQSGIPALQTAALVRALAAGVETLLWTLIPAAGAALAGWVLVEAFVRAGTLPLDGNSFIRDASSHFGRFLGTGLARRLILAAAAVLVLLAVLGPLLTVPATEWREAVRERRWPIAAGVMLVGLVAFFLVILETALRSDAWQALAADLPALVGVIAILVFAEGALLTLIVTVGWIAGLAAPPAARIGIAAVVVGVASLAHSWLLLARYSALAIMRRNHSKSDLIQLHGQHF